MSNQQFKSGTFLEVPAGTTYEAHCPDCAELYAALKAIADVGDDPNIDGEMYWCEAVSPLVNAAKPLLDKFKKYDK